MTKPGYTSAGYTPTAYTVEEVYFFSFPGEKTAARPPIDLTGQKTMSSKIIPNIHKSIKKRLKRYRLSPLFLFLGRFTTVLVDLLQTDKNNCVIEE